MMTASGAVEGGTARKPHLVTWNTVVLATNPNDAMRQVLEMMLEPAVHQPYFEITDNQGLQTILEAGLDSS